MHQAFKVLAMACAVAGFVAAEAQAEPRATASTTPQVPHCTRNVGTISIRNGDTAGWNSYRLAPPAGLLRVGIQQSGCFTVVERGAGLDAAMQERDLAGGGNLQRGSNVGGGSTDTDIGRVVTVAFIDAYTQLVRQLGVLDTAGGPSSAAAAPQRTY